MGLRTIPGSIFGRCRVLLDSVFKPSAVSTAQSLAASRAPLRSLFKNFQVSLRDSFKTDSIVLHSWVTRYGQKTLAGQVRNKYQGYGGQMFVRPRYVGFMAHALVGFSLMSNNLNNHQDCSFNLYDKIKEEYGQEIFGAKYGNLSVSEEDQPLCDENADGEDAEEVRAFFNEEDLGVCATTSTTSVYLLCPEILPQSENVTVNINFITSEKRNVTITLDVSVASEIQASVKLVKSSVTSEQSGSDGALAALSDDKEDTDASFEIIIEDIEDESVCNEIVSSQNLSWYPFGDTCKRNGFLDRGYDSFGSDITAAEDTLSWEFPERVFLDGRDDVDIVADFVMTYYPQPDEDATSFASTDIGENLWDLWEDIFK